jgi:hypothetical protein
VAAVQKHLRESEENGAGKKERRAGR